MNFSLDDRQTVIFIFLLIRNMYTNNDIDTFLKKIIDSQNQASRNGKNKTDFFNFNWNFFS